MVNVTGAPSYPCFLRSFFGTPSSCGSWYYTGKINIEPEKPTWVVEENRLPKVHANQVPCGSSRVYSESSRTTWVSQVVMVGPGPFVHLARLEPKRHFTPLNDRP